MFPLRFIESFIETTNAQTLLYKQISNLLMYLISICRLSLPLNYATLNLIRALCF